MFSSQNSAWHWQMCPNATASFFSAAEIYINSFTVGFRQSTCGKIPTVAETSRDRTGGSVRWGQRHRHLSSRRAHCEWAKGEDGGDVEGEVNQSLRGSPAVVSMTVARRGVATDNNHIGGTERRVKSQIKSEAAFMCWRLWLGNNKNQHLVDEEGTERILSRLLAEWEQQ